MDSIIQSYEKNAVNEITENGEVVLCELDGDTAETIEMFKRHGLEVFAVKANGFSVGVDMYKYILKRKWRYAPMGGKSVKATMAIE